MPRRNFIFHLLNGVFVAISEALNDPTLIMTALLSQLTTSNLLIGLLAPMRDTGWFLPQLFVSHRVQQSPRKIVWYQSATLFRIAGWLLVVIALFTLESHAALLWAFFVSMLLISISGGVGGLGYVTVTAKVIPPDQRGRLFGLREFVGGGLSVLMGGVGALILGGHLFGLTFAFPRNYGLLFAVSTTFFALGCFAFGLLSEPPDLNLPQPVRLSEQMGRAWRVLRTHIRFRNFVLMRATLLFARAGMPFLTVFAKRQLNISDAFLGVLVSITLGCSLVAGLAWGRLNDRRGSHSVLIVSLLLGAAASVTAIAMTRVDTALAQVLLVASVVLAGVCGSGLNVSILPLMMDIAPANDRPLYFGLNNTTLGVAMLLTTPIGLIADGLGFAALFGFCGLCFLAATRLLNATSDSHVSRPKQV